MTSIIEHRGIVIFFVELIGGIMTFLEFRGGIMISVLEFIGILP